MNPTLKPSAKRGTALPDKGHEAFMHRAVEIARTGLGRCAPNPSVGCIIVKDGEIIAEARSADGGRPHAEMAALEIAGERAKGAEVYATLEPCAHVGKTPSCAEELIKAGVRRVIVAYIDPDPRTCGKGNQKLRGAGIEVIEGVCADEARQSHEGFFTKLEKNRPFIALKVATSLDGKIAAADGSSQWITGEASRIRVHQLRSEYDAILTGSGTVLADNPSLTVRLPGHDGWQPKRIVLDRRGRITDKTLNIFKDDVPTHIISDFKNIEETFPNVLDLGVNRVLVEAGQGVASALLKSGAVDRIYWFRAPILLGDQGKSAFDGLDIASINQKLALKRHTTEEIGEDLLEIYAAPL